MESGDGSETKVKTFSGIDLDNIAGVGEILTLLLENTPDAIYLLVGSKFPLINTGFQKMFGVTLEEVNSPEFNFMEMIAPESRQMVLDRAEKYARGEQVDPEYEFRAVTKDGREQYVRTNTARIVFRGEDATLGIIRNITDRKEIEFSLRESEEKYRILVERATDGISIIQNGKLAFTNQRVADMLGYTVEELIDTEIIGYIHPDVREETMDRYRRRMAGETVPAVYESKFLKKDGSTTHAEVNAGLITYQNATADLIIVRDITERRVLEQQLMQAQKMEAIGRLAGGIAHDFNNILTIISGNAQLGMMALREDDPMRERLATIQKAAGHAEELTRRLLAFGRKQISSPRVVSINEIMVGLEKMLRRVIGEDIDLEIRTDSAVKSIHFDPTQLEQIFMNLVVNARDAMPEGGRLTITTENVQLGEDYTRTHPYMMVGPYVRVSITDTGVGMDEETRQQVFEPFFTTKEQGSGLGLATVYGIVKQSGGAIEVESSREAGTTIKIYLPVHTGPVEPFIKPEHSSELIPGHENVLLVEDEEGVRAFAAETLTELGYQVFDFGSPAEAWEYCEGGMRNLDLILTDVIMPGESGAELADRLKPLYPEVPVLFMSGHTDDFIVHHGVLDEGVQFIPKPFSPQELSRVLRNILDDSEE
ncbi:PAS domain S-box protein [Candidatus Zixiibacteriota bacterium]